jgi:hypothetical protein
MCVCVCVCTIGTIAIRLLTLITTGLAQRLRTDTTTATQQLQLDALNNQLEVADSVQFKIVAPLTLTVCDPSMLDFRESYLREAIVLLLRTITQCFPELLGVKSIQVGNLIFSPPKVTQSGCLFMKMCIRVCFCSIKCCWHCCTCKRSVLGKLMLSPLLLLEGTH